MTAPASPLSPAAAAALYGTSTIVNRIVIPPPDPVTIIAGYVDQQALVRHALLAAIDHAFLTSGSFRATDAERFVRTALPLVAGAQRAVAALTTAYTREIAAATLGAAAVLGVVQLAKVTGRAVRDVDPERVYRRPYEQVWTSLSRGRSFDDAVADGRRRAQNIMATDLQRTANLTTRAQLDDPNAPFTWYRRVLTGREDCGLCVVASSQRYHVRELLPIHPACDCAIAPISAASDPGQSINTAHVRGVPPEPTHTTPAGVPIYAPGDVSDAGDLLEPIHNAIDDRFGATDRGARVPDYRKVLTTHWHGELGPVISIHGDRFTGPDDLPT